MDHVRYTPFTVSIETKRAAGEDKAHVQLAVWVWAQFARLRQLAPAAKSWPVLPLVVVQGYEWRLLFAEVVDDGCAIRILQYVVLGATDIVLRAYQLVASLRRLARWVKDEYRPWFTREVLGIS
ncbi:uncharacterized protein K452DRAFT_257171 [Aplosporella prunicola CBS 121167]|uniref:PD-(D/E)XK nuclease-like domain-containing protein n=1 Tax=Aplosporella prunicola CBS 121167 TaxID=1176127 RepID=A0A6A6B0Z2_9PEZI|nr:uncharacterized protein K452DRAFT_257171 [Aplosporella prunicola CBS 121167]KAF2137700.1 hypothetical protein K452DRAFT_257171 [Aplosporella prunicola CBS 121167]